MFTTEIHTRELSGSVTLMDSECSLLKSKFSYLDKTDKLIKTNFKFYPGGNPYINMIGCLYF